MKFSYNWISELVSGLDVPASELSNLITMKTAESEGVEEYGSALSSVVAARVEAVEPIDGSKNVKAVIDAGSFREDDGGLRRAELPARHCDRLRAFRHEA